MITGSKLLKYYNKIERSLNRPNLAIVVSSSLSETLLAFSIKLNLRVLPKLKGSYGLMDLESTKKTMRLKNLLSRRDHHSAGLGTQVERFIHQADTGNQNDS